MFSAKQNKGKNAAKQEFGKEGELAAFNYLLKKGYSILGRNIWEKFGEIDILARDRSGITVFVEVKSVMANKTGYGPEDQMTSAKIRKLRRTCEFLANKYPEFINEKRGWRIDAICLTKLENNFEIKYYENIA